MILIRAALRCPFCTQVKGVAWVDVHLELCSHDIQRLEDEQQQSQSQSSNGGGHGHSHGGAGAAGGAGSKRPPKIQPL